MNLQELIATHKGDRSYREVAKLCGDNPTAGRLQQMAAGDLKEWPKPETVRNLAKGLRVTEVAVVLAVAESLGLDVERASSRFDEYLPAGAQNLTEDQMRAVGELVRSIVEDPAKDLARDEAKRRQERRDFLDRWYDRAPGAESLTHELDRLNFEADSGSWSTDLAEQWQALWVRIDHLMYLEVAYPEQFADEMGIETTRGGGRDEQATPQEPAPMNPAGTPAGHTRQDPDMQARMRRAVAAGGLGDDDLEDEIVDGQMRPPKIEKPRAGERIDDQGRPIRRDATVHQFPGSDQLPENLDELAARTEQGEPEGERVRREQDEAAEDSDDSEGTEQ